MQAILTEKMKTGYLFKQNNYFWGKLDSFLNFIDPVEICL